MARPVGGDERAAHAAHAAHVRMLRSATCARRAAMALSLSTTTVCMARAAIRRAHPTWSERELQLEFVRVHYGADLADRVRSYLAARGA